MLGKEIEQVLLHKFVLTNAYKKTSDAALRLPRNLLIPKFLRDSGVTRAASLA
jgi:hypothetical protein